MAVAARDDKEREFPFSSEDFAALVVLVKERTGIVLGDHKRDMVYGRLVRRLRALQLDSFAAYRARLEEDADEVGCMINAITTNLTKFFREPHHFEHLGKHVLGAATAHAKAGQRGSLRLWSAGCSSGEEPYSIAFCVASKLAELRGWDVKILATDLDTNMLRTGSVGVYRKRDLEPVPADLRSRYSRQTPDDPDRLQLGDELRKLVSFKQLNLLQDWPLRRAYDAIFCRNVVIYFDTPTKTRLIQRLTEQLTPGGFLYLGHSESLVNPGEQLKLIGRTTYQRLP